MARKKPITITPALAKKLSNALENYYALLDMESDSSINDSELKKEYKKSMTKIENLSMELFTATNE